MRWCGRPGLTVLGYLVGNAPMIRDNLELVLIIIVLISVLPMVFEYLRERRKLKAQAPPSEPLHLGPHRRPVSGGRRPVVRPDGWAPA